MATAVDTPTRSLRRELREFVEEILDSEDEVSLETLIRRAHSHFNGDAWIRDALIREGLNALLPQMVHSVRHNLRQQSRNINSPLSRRERIASVFEHVGDGFSKSILAMRRPEHLLVAHDREKQAAGHLRWAGFHRAVASLHTDDKTTTADLDPSAVGRLWAEHIERD